MARRARRLLSGLVPLGWMARLGIRVIPLRGGPVRGEWIVPRNHDAGVVLYIHGGGYVSGSPATHRAITTSLARRTRRRIFAVDYRVAPEHRFPAALDDVVAGYQWLLEQRIQPDAIAVAGDSAGGGLVLAALLRIRDAGLPAPSCGVCFSPWTDMTGTGESVRANEGRCATFLPENIHDFARAYLGGASSRDPYASPAFADLHGLPPVLLQVGSNEILLDDSRRVHDAIRAAGGESTLEIFDGMIHVWQMLDGFVPEATLAMDHAAAFMNSAHPRAAASSPSHAHRD